MATATRNEFAELLESAQHSAVHLETRDVYAVGDPFFQAWKAGEPFDRSERDQVWKEILVGPVSRGVEIRRARIVSEPVSDYIRYEHSITVYANIAAGEQVRWLSRRLASDLALPGNDFWLFDGETAVFNHFTGDGEWVGTEVLVDPAVTRLCASAFDAVWDRATPHQEYRLS
ncbi:DUF6879 family protein [Rhizohabitans arisaemae]|uniref:DUF6879 family protein n=1 Tax=Rhizohabitans arisaemae TaxID=2720610 RepID=UPI0024B2523B|nr:DUF6879 family protein [Rhizohabitans arisaemae]